MRLFGTLAMLVGAVCILLGVFQAVSALAGMYASALEQPMGAPPSAGATPGRADPLDDPGRVSAEMMRSVIAGALGIPLLLGGLVIRAAGRRRRAAAA